MGTSNSYSGSGSKAGKDLRQQLAEWIDSQGDGGTKPANPDSQLNPNDQPPTSLPPEALLPAISLLRPTISSRGKGGGGGGGGASGGGGDSSKGGSRRSGGAQRSAHRAATTAGRAAAAAYALKSGDRETLEKLGLSYDDLKKISDPLELTSKIVDAVCETPDGTISEEEHRYIAADVVEWVLEQSDKELPDPQDIAHKAIASVINEVVLSEVGGMLREKQITSKKAAEIERDIREGAEVLAEKAKVSVNGAKAADFTRAVEKGVETLRKIIRRSER